MDIDAIVDREKALGLSLPFWVSGDYSAATDNVEMFYTKLVFETYLNARRLPLNPNDNLYQDVLRSVLYHQIIHYPRSFNGPRDEALPDCVQENGQLMGSVLSFPILCLINLCGYWDALNRYLGFVVNDFTKLPVLINGDDIIFRADDRLYGLWQESLKELNFILSLGKNYSHPKILTVNSQFFHWREGHAERVNYLNIGLLTGQTKITGRSSAKKLPLWAFYNECMNGAVNPPRAHRRFIHYNRKALEELVDMNSTTSFNLFLPPERGGLGFIPPPGVKYKVSNFQRHFATFLEHLNLQNLERGVRSFQLGLIREKADGPKRIPLHTAAYLAYAPSIGPLPEEVEPIHDTSLQLPLLSQPSPNTEDMPSFSVRFPRKKMMSEFREGKWNRMSDIEIKTYPYRLCEVKSRLVLSLRADGDLPVVTLTDQLDKFPIGSRSSRSKTVSVLNWRLASINADRLHGPTN
jgi:hypothetical protein